MGIDKIWIFSIQDNICGGFVVADSEEEAREKLSQDRGVDMGPAICLITPLSACDLSKSVHDLW